LCELSTIQIVAFCDIVTAIFFKINTGNTGVFRPGELGTGLDIGASLSQSLNPHNRNCKN